MQIEERRIKGVFTICLKPHEDERGFFMRTYDDKIFAKHGLHRKWVQENHSYSRYKGTVRGLHFQFPPVSEAKLIRAARGTILIVYVDIRRASSSFGNWDSLVLSEDNKLILFVPQGFALGMRTLSDHCSLLYKMDNYYAPEKQGIIKWDDPDLSIDWRIEKTEKIIVSERDTQAPSFKDFLDRHKGI